MGALYPANMARVKAYELREKSKADLEKQLDELKQELTNLRVAAVTGGAPSKLAKIRVVRKSIARVLTVINQTQKLKLRKSCKNNKYKPLDLRAKKTRAWRRKLSTTDAKRKTLKQRKKLQHFPMRKYALKA